MERRFSRFEKGKGQAPPELPTKRPLVRIPANDYEDLIEVNRLTIIGRLTNLQVQKPIRAVIEFMSQVWNLEGRIVGRPLGLDKFQFKFDSEYDLLQVLDKGPYHYKRWMLLLQRWEPVVSENFPSKISFNVRIHGIPLHFWHDETIRIIGSELGRSTIKDVKDARIWVEMNGLAPLVMTMDIELPTADITEVEFEYIKIEKHCFTCFSLFHEEADCPHRPINALPPKERNLGITQSIGLQRIEAEKRRHDDRRGYRRPEDLHSNLRQDGDNYGHYERYRVNARSGNDRREDYSRHQSIISRTARSNSCYVRSKAPSLQYRVVERNRPSVGSSAHQQSNLPEVSDLRSLLPLKMEKTPPAEARPETTPTRTIKERLGGPSNTKAGSKSDSKERRPALERLSGSNQSKEQTIRQAPSFENGRLQEVESRVDEGVPMDQEPPGEIPTEPERIPATHRLGFSASGAKTRRATIPIAAQSKPASKRRVNPIRKRVVRSPLLGLTQRKTSGVRSATSARRKLVVEQEKDLPCDKAGTSKQRKKISQPTTVFIPGSTRGGVDFWPHQKFLP